MSYNNGLKSDNYSRRQELYLAVRARASALNRASETARVLQHWDPTQIPDTLPTTKNLTFKGIEAVEEYMKRYAASSLDAMSNEDVGLGYSIFGDISRRAMLGANTVGIDMVLDWKTCDVEVGVYSGMNREMIITQATMGVKADAGKDLAVVSKATGWDRSECYKMDAEQVRTLSALVSSAQAGYNKYTRLVKGMMIYLDLLSEGKQSVKKDVKIVRYEMRDVLASFQNSGRSYAFCSDPTSPSYLVVLSMIGEQYPHPDMQCYGAGYIPADGDEHWVVVQGNTGKAAFYGADLTAQTVMASLIKYATESGCADELESAMVTAATLYYNRYLARASLPRVVSAIDLIRPMFAPANDPSSSRPHVTNEMIVTVGKLHQMCMFLTIKDIIIAAKASTGGGFNYSRVAEQYLTTQEDVINSLNGSATPLNVLEQTRHLRWMHAIDSEVMADLDDLSILEALWLADGGITSIRDGGIMAFKKGVSDMDNNNPYRQILKEEMQKANIVFDFSKLPQGSFTVSSRYIRSVEKSVVRRRPMRLVKVDIVHHCDFNPNDKLLNVAGRVRLSRRDRKPPSVRSEYAERPTGRGSDEASSEIMSMPDWPEAPSTPEKRVAFGGMGRGLREDYRAHKRASDVSEELSKIASEVDREHGTEWRSGVAALAKEKSVSPGVVEPTSPRMRRKSKSRSRGRSGSGDRRTIGRPGIDFTKLSNAMAVGEATSDVAVSEDEEDVQVEVSVMKGARSSMGLSGGAETDIDALKAEGIESKDRLGKRTARDVFTTLRGRYDSEALPPANLARLMSVLKGTTMVANLAEMDAEDIVHATSVRDAYDRGFRGMDSGRTRVTDQENGKLLSLEINLRNGRYKRSGVAKSTMTGVIGHNDLKIMSREFYMATHEIRMVNESLAK